MKIDIKTTDDLLVHSNIKDIRIIDYDLKKQKIIDGIILCGNESIWKSINRKIKFKDYFRVSHKYNIDEDELFLDLIYEKYLNPSKIYIKPNYVFFIEFSDYEIYLLNIKNVTLDIIVPENYIVKNMITNYNKINANFNKKDDFIESLDKHVELIKNYFKPEHLNNVLKLINIIFDDNNVSLTERIIIDDHQQILYCWGYYQKIIMLNFFDIFMNLLDFLHVKDEEIAIINNISLHRNIKSTWKYIVINYEDKKPDENKVNLFLNEVEKTIHRKIKAVIYCSLKSSHNKNKIFGEYHPNYENLYNQEHLREFINVNYKNHPQNTTFDEKYIQIYTSDFTRPRNSILFILALFKLNLMKNN